MSIGAKMAVRTWWREKRVNHDTAALDIVHSLLSDGKIYVVTCAFGRREKDVFLGCVVEGEMGIETGLYVTSFGCWTQFNDEKLMKIKRVVIRP